MIGVVLHLAALVPAAVAARVTRAALGLLCRAPQGSEVEQLAEEVDALREERDTARIEHAAAVEVCDELKELLATARTERDQARAQAEDREALALKNFNAYCRERHQFDALAEVARALVVARRRLDTAWAAERSQAALALLDAWKPLLDLFPEEVAAPDLTDDEAPRG